MNQQDSNAEASQQHTPSKQEDSLRYQSWSDNLRSSQNPLQAHQSTRVISSLLVGAPPQDEDGEDLSRDGMTSQRMLAYSVGHFSNDLFASMWFIYQSYYYLNVLQLSNSVTGMALLCG